MNSGYPHSGNSGQYNLWQLTPPPTCALILTAHPPGLCLQAQMWRVFIFLRETACELYEATPYYC